MLMNMVSFIMAYQSGGPIGVNARQHASSPAAKPGNRGDRTSYSVRDNRKIRADEVLIKRKDQEGLFILVKRRSSIRAHTNTARSTTGIQPFFHQI